MATPIAPRYRIGDRVRILHSNDLKGRVAGLSGPLAPGGVEVYVVRLRGGRRPWQFSVSEDQLELLPPAATADAPTAAASTPSV